MFALLVSLSFAAAPSSFFDLGFVLRGEGAFSGGVGAPSVEYDGSVDQFVMYFESPAPSGETPAGCANSYRIGRATSPDGVSWSIDETPVLTPDPSVTGPRACSVAQPAVLFDGAQWNLFYSASTLPLEGETANAPSGIGWATSPDGVSWTVQDEVLVAFESASIGLSSATALNGTLYLAYAEYPDLYVVTHPLDGGGGWTAPARALDHATLGDWSSYWVLGPSMLCNEDSDTPVRMLFGGDTTGDFERSLAWAGTANGKDWTVDEGSPFSMGNLDYGALNHWEALRAGGGFDLWYSQTDSATGHKAIGAAVTDVRLGPVQPRVCPSPWAAPDPDTGDTGATADTADTGNVDTGVACDCPSDGCGCAHAEPRAFLGLFLLPVLRRRDKR